MLKVAGYQTAIFGMWHLGFGYEAPDWNQPLNPRPLELGFDYFYGIPCANSVPPYVYVENYLVDGLKETDPIAAKRKPIYAKKLPEKGAGHIGGGKRAHELYVDETIGTNLTERSIKWMEGWIRISLSFYCFPRPTFITHLPQHRSFKEPAKQEFMEILPMNSTE